METFKIALAAKNTQSALAQFIWDQIGGVEWIAARRCNFEQTQQLKDVTLVVAILEDTSFKEISDICSNFRKTKTPALYLSFWNNQIIVGPTHFPGRTAGADSCFLALKKDNTSLSKVTASVAGADEIQESMDIFHAAFADMLAEIKTLYLDEPLQKLKFIDSVLLYDPGSKSKAKPVSTYVYPFFDRDEHIADPQSLSAYKILYGKYEHSKIHTRSHYFNGAPLGMDPVNEYINVAIIGGGTAGYLTALSLKNAYPDLPVTLIESSKIPVIGVGEATTPQIRDFLFDELKFSPLDFYEKVKPTWKLGIRFFWGQPGDYHFNYPFGTPDVRSSYLFNGDINSSSLISILMSTNSSFVVSATDKHGDKQLASLSNDLQYALQLDNVSFIGYLKEKALERGIIHIDDQIVDSEKKADSNELQAVIGEGGKRYAYDFFVDCTGFKSLLIEKTLGSPYVSYSSSLFTDTAVTGHIPNVEKIKPYTLAESMNNGWCWSIPMRGEDHRGYVFSSAHCSIDEAADELRLKNPTISDLKTVRFRSGRHQEICIGNVFAIGNSFAFVEPLESTGIHMILKEVAILTKNFPMLKKSPVTRKMINAHMNDHWDYIRDFLSIHYKFNKKFDTKFWKEVRADADVSSIQWLLDLYHEVGLVSYAGENFTKMINERVKDEIFGLIGFDTVLLGQGVVPKNFDRTVKNKQVWDANVNTWKAIQLLTIPLEQDLHFLAQSMENHLLRI
jgi:tryptophan halogenase